MLDFTADFDSFEAVIMMMLCSIFFLILFCFHKTSSVCFMFPEEAVKMQLLLAAGGIKTD